jgi:hypothetical protein
MSLMVCLFSPVTRAEVAGIGNLKICGSIKLSPAQYSELTTHLTVLSASAMVKKKEIIALTKAFKTKLADERSTAVDVAEINAKKIELKTSLMRDLDRFWTTWYFDILEQEQRAPAYNCSRLVEQVLQALI